MNAISSNILGTVVIGRNEGTRLQKCLQSITAKCTLIVYVDSGSTDGSVVYAESVGVDVVNLDLSRPFTAARARNEGFDRLIELAPTLEFVQFVDGDCEIVEDWFDKALDILNRRADVAIVCGRRRERFPDSSIYNKFCDIEWNTPIGDTDACGGDALMRVTPFKELEGYNPSLIAGEEPELCVRLRLAGWKICRIDAEMTLHDADMHHFSQWWKRTVRTGHAFAEGYALHGQTHLRHYARPARSIYVWGLAVPGFLFVSLLAAFWTPWALLITFILLVGYSTIVLRSYVDARKRGGSITDSLLYGLSIILTKFPQLIGALRYHTNRLRGKESTLIEYKTSVTAKNRT